MPRPATYTTTTSWDEAFLAAPPNHRQDTIAKIRAHFNHDVLASVHLMKLSQRYQTRKAAEFRKLAVLVSAAHNAVESEHQRIEALKPDNPLYALHLAEARERLDKAIAAQEAALRAMPPDRFRR